MVNYSEYQMACAEENKALDEYLDLRDAKSNGCCSGLPIIKIFEYDRQIEAAAERWQTLEQKLNSY